MHEALSFILSSVDRWCYDTEGKFIIFNQDGTGELWCFINFNYWIVADMEWRSIGLHPSSPTDSAHQNEGPHLLGQLEIEMTLLKRLPQCVGPSAITEENAPINEKILTEDAFRPKSYIIRIEQGNFMKPCVIGLETWDTRRFAFRLLFDQSPYPPRTEWKKPEGGPDANQLWEHREFVGQASAELEKMPGKAMNDTSVQERKSCVIL